PGYEIDYLRVDNAYVAATEEYSFNNVKTSHSIEAFFKAVPTPIANFTASSVTGSSPLEVLFQDESQNIITSRLWDFGDGATSTSLNPKHTYFKPGTYSVTYTVYGPGGQDTHVKKDLIIIHDMYINFTATPSSGAFPLTSTFTPQLPD
ncbi:cell surface protein, partial [Candidatus Magnetomorum sp. HK-1]